MLHQQKTGKNQGAWVTCRAATPATCPINGGIHFPTQEAAEAYDNDLNETLYPTTPISSTVDGVQVEQDLLNATRNRIPLTPQQATDRAEYAEKAIRVALRHGVTTDQLYGQKQPDGTTIWDPDRMRAHEQIINSILNNPDLKYNHEAVFSGGLGGAGKTTVLTHHAGINPSQYVTINPDDVKEIMAERGMIPTVAGLTPMECSTLAHEEASYISKVLMGRAARAGANIIVDGVMSNQGAVTTKIRLLEQHGYQRVRCVFVDITPTTSGRRAQQRYQYGMNQYTTSGGSGYGGRFLPSFVNNANTPTDPRFKSGSAENIAALAGFFTEKPVLYDNEGEAPRRITWEEFTNANQQ